MSEDDTHVGWLFRQGKITEREARNHSARNALQQVLGGKTQQLNPQLGAIAVESGDCFLICSDGLVEGLWDKGMERIVRKPPPHLQGNPAERLVREAVDQTVRTTPLRWSSNSVRNPRVSIATKECSERRAQGWAAVRFPVDRFSTPLQLFLLRMVHHAADPVGLER